MKTAKVRVRRHGAGQFVASVTLNGEETPHLESEPVDDPDVAAGRGKWWAILHGVKVSMVLFESGIKGLAAVGDDHAEAP